MTEYVILVDEQDQEVGVAEKLFAHQQALAHRAFSVFIYRKQAGEIQVLLQQRHPEKYHCGNLWTNTCCGHPRPGEEIKAAAERRLFEEMGLKFSLIYKAKFHYVAPFENGLTENEMDYVFVAEYDGQAITPHQEEIAEYRWESVSSIQEFLEKSPEKFTPWLKQALFLSALTT